MPILVPARNALVRRGLFVLLLATVTACDQRALFEQMIPKDDAAFGERVIAQLRARDFDAVEAVVDRTSPPAPLRRDLERLAAMFPAGDARSAKVVGALVQTVSDVRYADLTYEHEFADQWLVTAMRLRQTADGLRVQSLSITPYSAPQEELNAFALAGRTPRHYLMLAAAIAATLPSRCRWCFARVAATYSNRARSRRIRWRSSSSIHP